MLRKKLKSQKYFVHLLLTISTFFVVATLFLSGTLYSSFRSLGESIINQSSQKLLSQIAGNVSFIDNYAYNYSAALFNNPLISRFMFVPDLNIYDTLGNIQQLQNAVQSTPFVYSIYIYNAQADRYYIIGPHTDILAGAEMYDTEMVELLHSSTARTAAPLARQVPVSRLNSDAPAKLYTYWVSQSDLNQQLTGSLVINVRMDWIFETLMPSAEDRESNANIVMVDGSGRVVGHSDSDRFLTDLSGEPYAQKVMASAQSSGYFVDQVDGRKSVVVYSTLKQPDWKIINIIPYESLSHSIQKIGSITLTISLLVFVTGLLIAYMLSRRLYSPVQGLRQRIGQLLGASHNKADFGNEFQDMESNISEAVEHLLALKQFKNSHIQRLKADFLNRLLAGRASVERRPEGLNLRIADSGSYAIILLKLDNYTEFVSARSEIEQASLRFALANIATELLSARFRCEAIDSGQDFCILILNTKESLYSPDTDTEEQLDRLLRELQEVYHAYFHITVSCFKTESCASLSQLHELYDNARHYAMERLRCGHGCLISYRELQRAGRESFDVSDALVEDFLQKLKGLKKEEITGSLERIMEKLYRCDYNTTMCLLSHILSSVFNYLNTLEKNGTVKFKLSFLAYHGAMTGMETLEQVRGLLLGLFDGIFQQLEQSRDGRYSLIVESAVQYIRNNYMDKNLSQHAVADVLKISPVTLGKIFRETTGGSIADYLKDLRLVKAQEYLRNTHYSIDEIVEEIGWGNKKYFSTVFKQTFAVTPMEYRLKTALDYSQGDSQGKKT